MTKLSRLGGLLLFAMASFTLATSAFGQATIMTASATPSTVDSADGQAVELGVKFKADTSGFITGLRFYKASTNTGTHVGHIWSTSGVLLGSATFTSESKSGWQQVNFASPIAVSANTVYIASYFAPKGHYSESVSLFAKGGVDRPPLHALADGVSGADGVYVYSSKSAFPTTGWESTYYWVDVVYTPSQSVPANPQLTIGATSLNFGTVAVNSSATQSLTLTSSGGAAVTVSSAAISGAGFSIVGGTLPATLNPNQTLTLQLQFKPTAGGSATGQLTINSNSTTGSTATVSLSGTGTATNPQLTVSTTSLSFGSVAVNSSVTKSLVLTSSGTAAVTVNSAAISGTGFTIVGGTLPATLNPNQTLTLQLQFKPTASGSATGQLTIKSNSTTGGTATVSLSGTGTATNPQLTVSSTSLSFGSVTVNSSATKSLSLTSSGTSAVTVNSVAISGTGFTIAGGTFPATLNPNQSLTLQIQFTPTASGSATGQLTINSNSTTGGTAAVSLSGTGTAANPQITLGATSLSFGNLAVNTSATQSVTLTSAGTSALTVNSASISGAGFTLVGGSYPVTLNPQQSITVQVQFKPTASGSVTGQLTFSSNSATNGTAVVSLSGTGTSVAHEADLSWSAPSTSADPVAGYNIYRSTSSSAVQKINPSPDAQVTYADTTVVSGTTYTYFVTSIDSNGIESVPSNQINVTIP